METFIKDLKHSFRMFWQSRGFTAAAVAALALGIGSNTAIYQFNIQVPNVSANDWPVSIQVGGTTVAQNVFITTGQ